MIALNTDPPQHVTDLGVLRLPRLTSPTILPQTRPLQKMKAGKTLL